VSNHPAYPCIPAMRLLANARAGNQSPSSIHTKDKGYWVPAFAGMIGILVFGCSSELSVDDKYLVCKHELSGHENMPLTLKLSSDSIDTVLKKAEVSYGISTKSAQYFETDEKYYFTLPKNATFPECLITIDRLSGFGKHLCAEKSDMYPNDPRAQTFELTCKIKTEKL